MSESTTLGALVAAGHLELGDGYRTKRSEHGQPGLPILRVAEVLDGTISPASEDYVSDAYRRAMGAKVSQAGDVVLTTKGTVGRVATIPEGSPEFVYSPQLCYFRVHPGSPLSARYLYYWFKSDFFWSQAGSRKSQTDMADYINLADIRSLQISLPSPSSQRAIVEVLGALDDKIAVNDQIVQSSHGLIQALWTKLALGAQDFVRVSDVAVVDKGLSYKGEGLGGGAPLVNLGNFGSDGRFKVSALKFYDGESKDRHWVNRGDLMMANTDLTQRRDILGQPALALINADKALFTHHVFVIRPGVGLEDERLWLYGAFRDPLFRDRAMTYATGTTVLALPRDAVLSYKLPWPEQAARRNWTGISQSLVDSSNARSEESRQLSQLRDSLLPGLMSGAISVRSAERVAEDAL
ncbi:restriction endonuclease subunit S [Micromonospora sp. DT201]|uniref:restriction endonuclease subunit S n=1 Tax=Micromonospora sp. DT201 TaxID=3393442 RepID=UPI003CF2F8C2